MIKKRIAPRPYAWTATGLEEEMMKTYSSARSAQIIIIKGASSGIVGDCMAFNFTLTSLLRLSYLFCKKGTDFDAMRPFFLI